MYGWYGGLLFDFVVKWCYFCGKEYIFVWMWCNVWIDIFLILKWLNLILKLGLLGKREGRLICILVGRW